MQSYGIIYLLWNKCNNKFYVGQTILKFKDRLNCHKNDSKKKNNKINRAISKYGWNNFDKLILDVAHSKEDLDQLEIFYIDKFQAIKFGYNIRFGGSKGKLSQSTKDKISNVKKNKPCHPNLILGNQKYIETKKQKVIRLATNEIFDSIHECARKLDINYSALRLHLIGERQTTNKEKFAFV